MVIDSPLTVMPLFSTSRAPFDTVVLPLVLPKAEALATVSWPALTVVCPVYVFVPLRVSSPAPLFVRPPPPPPSSRGWATMILYPFVSKIAPPL